jgi:hypothetical protein
MHYRKSVWKLLKRQKIELLYDPVIPYLDIHPKEYKSTHKRDTCISMFIAALLESAQVSNNQ